MEGSSFVIYLDTHVVLWLYEGLLDRLPDFAKQQLEENDLFISPIVQLELEYLFEIKRIKRDSKTIVNDLIDRIALQTCQAPLLKIIQIAIKLNWTRDPFDRLIVANAQ